MTSTFPEDYDGYQKVLRWRARSAVRHACAKYTCQEFQTMRPYVNDEMQKQVSPRTKKKSRAGDAVLHSESDGVERRRGTAVEFVSRRWSDRDRVVAAKRRERH